MISERSAEARKQGGIMGAVKRGLLSVQGGIAFARIFLLPVRHNELPSKILLQPVW